MSSFRLQVGSSRLASLLRKGETRLPAPGRLVRPAALGERSARRTKLPVVALLVPAYQIGDPFEGSAHPLAVALGSVGYFTLLNAVVIGGAGLLAFIRDRRRDRRVEGDSG